MTMLRLMLASLWRFRRTNAGVLLGVAVSTAVITGALIVGDSMRHTLQATADQRLGNISHAVLAGDRFVTSALVDQLGDHTSGAVVLTAVTSTPDGKKRVNETVVVGVDLAFSKLFNADWQPAPGEALLSESLRQRLDLEIGSELILRTPELSALPVDASLVNASTSSLAIKVRVAGTVKDESGGRFGLRAEQQTPMNVFVDRDWLAEQVDRAGRVNLVMTAGPPEQTRLSLPDMELSLKPLADNRVELASPRVFLDASIERDLADVPGQRLLTYLVNTIANGEKQSPYAMVCAANKFDGLDGTALADNEIVINQWLADDIGAAVGDTLKLTYYLPDEGNRLHEASAEMAVVRVVDDAFGDRSMTPDFPGLDEAQSLRRWDAGPAIDRSRIRNKDEAYWEAYKATPKAFISLATGQRLWTNRFGTLTAIRLKDTTQASDIAQRIDPASLGLAPVNVREQANKAAAGTVDFGQLFLSLSAFIIIAAVVLTATLFAMSAEYRARQFGTLLALGLTRGQVLRLIVGEGLVVALVGAALGLWGGITYAQQVTGALSGVWAGAVAGTPVSLKITAMSLLAGPLSAVLISVLAMLFASWSLSARPARELIAGAIGRVSQPAKIAPAWWLALAALLLVPAVLLANKGSGMLAALAGFGAGACLLAAVLLAFFAILVRSSAKRKHDHAQKHPLRRLSLSRLAMRNLTRRRGRTLAAVVTLGCGVFLVLAVSGFRLGMSDDPTNRSSGTGGFALIVEAGQPIRYDLNTQLARDHYFYSEKDLPTGTVVPIRMNAGDDASCLNLNQTPRPRVLGVDPELMKSRNAFSFLAESERGIGWSLLSMPAENPDAVPALADANTAQWALKLPVGATMTLTDERGQPFDIQLVGTLDNTILQGSLIISEDHFERLYPSVSGHRLLLVDHVGNQTPDVTADFLQEVLVDEGVQITPTADRLAAYNTVQNTYLTIFQALGGLGVVLGSLGLGVIAARNLLERRAEFALLSAVGLSRGRVALIALLEHGVLLLTGLGVGVVSAALATVHTGKGLGGSGGAAALTAGTALLAGLVALAIALRASLSGKLSAALRND